MKNLLIVLIIMLVLSIIGNILMYNKQSRIEQKSEDYLISLNNKLEEISNLKRYNNTPFPWGDFEVMMEMEKRRFINESIRDIGDLRYHENKRKYLTKILEDDLSLSELMVIRSSILEDLNYERRNLHN